MSWLVPREELTAEQCRAIDLDAAEHRLIVGGPGSGKTQILVHRARGLLDLYGVRADRFRIFVFTNALKKYIQSSLDDLDLPTESVSTFSSWCCDYYRETVDKRLPQGDHTDIDFDAVRDGVLKSLGAMPTAWRPFDFLLVDEAQDLTDDDLKIIRRIAAHVTLCADRKQQIYDGGAEETVIAQTFGIRRCNVTLIDGFRCSPYVTRLAAVLAGSERETSELINQCRTDPGERETPLLRYTSDLDDEVKCLTEVLSTRQLAGDRIGILVPLQRQVYGFSTGLRRLGFEVEILLQRRAGHGRTEELDFNSDVPKLMTYHSAKGLTFDSVLLPRLVKSSFRTVSEERSERLLFVATSRATKWVYMSTSRNEAFKPLEKILPLRDEGVLTVQGERAQADLFA